MTKCKASGTYFLHSIPVYLIPFYIVNQHFGHGGQLGHCGHSGYFGHSSILVMLVTLFMLVAVKIIQTGTSFFTRTYFDCKFKRAQLN